MDGRIDGQTVLHPYHVTQHSDLKGNDTYNGLDGSQVNYAEFEKPIWKGHILYDSSIYMIVLKWQNHKISIDHRWPGLRKWGEQEGGRLGYKRGTWEILVVMEIKHILTVVMDTQAHSWDETAWH